jgi:argininosuccinate synthase
VVPLVRAGELYQDQYPLLVSDRYVIVERALRRSATRSAPGRSRTAAPAWATIRCASTSQTVRSLGDYEILAPIREIQSEHPAVRAYEAEYLRARGFAVRAKQARYTINENLLGVTMPPGRRSTSWRRRARDVRAHGAPRGGPGAAAAPRSPSSEGVAVALDGARDGGPAMLRQLNERLGAYGVGRGIYTGDTTIGLKGRIVFEAPGLSGLLTAHRALEEAC